MDDVTIARALHVLAIVLWIGGVGLVTTVLLQRDNQDANGATIRMRMRQGGGGSFIP